MKYIHDLSGGIPLYAEVAKNAIADENGNNIGETYVPKEDFYEAITAISSDKLDTSAFSTVSGNFITAISESGAWNEATSVVQENSAAWFDNVGDKNVNNWVYNNSAATENTNNAVTTSADTWNTVTAKANASDLADATNQIETISGDLNTVSGYATDWNTNKDTVIANGNSGVSALNTITANSAAWSNGAFVTATLTPGENPVPNVPEPTNKVIYLTKENGSELKDPYTEWIYSDKWEIIGETTVDLSDYYTKNDTSSKNELSNEFAKYQLTGDYATTGDLNTASSTLVNKIEYVSGQVDNKLDSSAATAYAPVSITGTVNTLTAASAGWNEVSAKVNTTAMTAYYQKTDTSSKDEISNALAGKQDTLTAGTNLEIVNGVIGVRTDNCSANNDEYAFVEGIKCNAQGKASHAEGYSTTANGMYSHAESRVTQANGVGSHAEGYYTTAQANYSHAEGASTQANGEGSHAEGYNTSAVGDYSHTEGNCTSAKGPYSHAEGITTITSGNGSHAEGVSAQALTTGAHAEGSGTIAKGKYSHSEGTQTSALSIQAHSEGQLTIASGIGSHAEGAGTSANGNYSHAEGYLTLAKGQASHAEGEYTIAGSNYMLAVGKYNATSANATFVIGNGSKDARSDILYVTDSDVVFVTGGNSFSLTKICSALSSQYTITV